MTVTVYCRFKHETDSAVLVVDLDDDNEYWFPWSQVEKCVKDEDGIGSIIVSDWIAKQKGLET